FIAFGVIIGGAIIGSVGTFLTGGAPLSAIARIAQSLKIWAVVCAIGGTFDAIETRSEEHTSELQSRFDLVCRLLLEKKKLLKEDLRASTRAKLSPGLSERRAAQDGRGAHAMHNRIYGSVLYCYERTSVVIHEFRQSM